MPPPSAPGSAEVEAPSGTYYLKLHLVCFFLFLTSVVCVSVLAFSHSPVPWSSLFSQSPEENEKSVLTPKPLVEERTLFM